MKKECYVAFEEERIREEFNMLKSTNHRLFEHINRAIDVLKANPFHGKNIEKKKIPEHYIKKYVVTNLFKYNLPEGMRLIYTVKGSKIGDKPIIISSIIHWMTHRDYCKMFGYDRD